MLSVLLTRYRSSDEVEKTVMGRRGEAHTGF